MSTLTLGIAVHLLVEERRPFFWARCLKLDPDANIVDSLAALVKLPAWVEADDLVFWELLAPVPYKDRLKLRDYRCPAAAKDKMTNISGSKSVGSLVQLEDSSMRVLVTNFYYPQLHFAFTDEPGSPRLSLRGSMIHPEMYLSNIPSLICSTLSISPKDGVDLFKPSEPHPIKLSVASTLEGAYPEGLKKDDVHLIVSIRKRTEAHNLHAEAPHGGALEILAAQSAAPSTAGQLEEHRRFQESNNNVIRCHQPPVARSIFPVTLLFEGFGHFVDNLSNTGELIGNDGPGPTLKPSDYSDYSLARDWRETVLSQHANELALQSELLRVWQKHDLGITPSHPVADPNFSADGDTMVDGSMLVVVKVRTSLGSDGADPMVEAMWYRIRSLIEQNRTRRLDDRCYYPALVMIVSGPLVGFYGAVLANEFILDFLGSYSFQYNVGNLAACKRAVRIVKALRILLHELRNAGQGALNASPWTYSGSSTTQSSIVPYQRTFKPCGSSQDIAVNNFQRVHSRKPVYTGTITVNGEVRKVLVKYVQRYSIKAHQVCHDLGFAPALLGWEIMSDEWKMIVMEYLEGWINLTIGPHPTQAQLTTGLEKLQAFNSKGWVHGDIRDVNTMYSTASNCKYDGLCLVDFDWAGEAGKTLYPWNMKMKGIIRAKEAKPCGVIDASHDEEVFRKLWILGM